MVGRRNCKNMLFENIREYCRGFKKQSVKSLPAPFTSEVWAWWIEAIVAMSARYMIVGTDLPEVYVRILGKPGHGVYS